MEIRTYTTATTERSTYYCFIYSVLLGLISFGTAALFHWITTVYIPFRAFVWIGENLSILFGLALFIVLAILLYQKVDRTSTLNVTRVFTNSVYNKQNGVCYGIGWNIGNILEKYQGEFQSFIESDSTEEDKPLKVKSLNDEPQVWGTLVIQAVDGRVLNYGTTKPDMLAAIKPILRSYVKSLLERFMASKTNEEILGHNEEVSLAVNSQLANIRRIQESGFKVEWVTTNMDESVDAANARKGLILAENLAKGIAMIETKQEDMYDESGTKVKEGALCREEALAGYLVAQGKAGAEFKRNRNEHTVRIESSDPEALKVAAQSGVLLGIAGGVHPVTHTPTT